jgi:uncharacterized membrane protein
MVSSFISGKELQEEDAVKAQDLREGIFNLIKKEHPGFERTSYLSHEELNHFRKNYLSTLMGLEKEELNQLEKDAEKAIADNKARTAKAKKEAENDLTFGQRIADKVAEFGGSWYFIISFFVFIILWASLNLWILAKHPFDPYPFILLNLILSCIAAIQAPIIMMSQNRQEEKDRERAENDYKINLKAELEIKLLTDKVNHLMVHQNKKLLEIQQVQTDLLEELMEEVKKRKG